MKLWVPIIGVVVASLIGEIYSLRKAAESSRQAEAEKVEKPTDPEGLVLYWVWGVPIEMHEEDDYGVLLVNDGGEEDPKPRYILGISKTSTLVDTQDLKVFKRALSTIPNRSIISWYGTCTVPRYRGLSKEQKEEFKSSIEGAGLIFSGEERVTCYCRGDMN